MIVEIIELFYKSGKIIMKFYPIVIEMIFSSFIIFCSEESEYKIFKDDDPDKVKERYVYDDKIYEGRPSDELIRSHKMYLVKVPTYDSKTKLKLPSQQEWVWTREYEKIKNIIDGQIDESTRFPILVKKYDKSGMSYAPIYFRLLWVTAQRKDEIKKQAEFYKNRLKQAKFQNAAESLFGFLVRKK